MIVQGDGERPPLATDATRHPTSATLAGMSITGIAAESNDIHTWLLDGFIQLLDVCQPRSLLDVGCGKGQLIQRAAARGIPAIGLDQPTPHLLPLQQSGLDVREGTAYDLPFDDASIDWVTLRHIPHHLDDPGRAFAQAMRVARSGVIIAEPWFDISVPSQRTAVMLDHWEKRQHRRGGMYHQEVLDIGTLLELLPQGFEQCYEMEVRHFLLLRSRCMQTFITNTACLLDDLPAEHDERDALAAVAAAVERDGLTWNGSLCLTLRRR